MVNIQIKNFKKLISDYVQSNFKTGYHDMSDAEFYAHNVLGKIHEEVSIILERANEILLSLNGNDEPEIHVAEALVDELVEIKEFIEIISTNGNLDNCCTPTIDWNSKWEFRYH